jgi:hypothetical protein
MISISNTTISSKATAGGYDPVFEYTRPQPFLGQVDDTLTADPMFKVAH